MTSTGGGATRPIPRDGAWRNSTETQQSGHDPRPEPEVKNGRSSAKDDVPEAQMRDNPGGGVLDPAEDVCWCCKKKSPSVLSCIGKRTGEGCDRGSEVWTVFTADEMGRASSSEETEKVWQEREL